MKETNRPAATPLRCMGTTFSNSRFFKQPVQPFMAIGAQGNQVRIVIAAMLTT